jgi:hypothetical protein
VVLDDTQKNYVDAGNKMAFRFLKGIYDGDNIICSPLSLQYALAMTANGASGETLREIIDFLGYGEDGIEALNEYNKTLLEQLPAVDLDVTLKVTDALLVNDRFSLLPEFKETVTNSYYAAVDNMDTAIAPSYILYWPENTRPAATSIPPAIFPKYTTIQFFNIPPREISFSNNGIVKRQFPVKSSLPARRTKVSPPGKIHPLINLPIADGCTATAAVEDPIPPRAMNAPASTAKRNILSIGVFTLFFPIVT